MKKILLLAALILITTFEGARAFSEEKESVNSSAATHLSDPDEQTPNFGNLSPQAGESALTPGDDSRPMNSLSAVPDQLNGAGYLVPESHSNIRSRN